MSSTSLVSSIVAVHGKMQGLPPPPHDHVPPSGQGSAQYHQQYHHQLLPPIQASQPAMQSQHDHPPYSPPPLTGPPPPFVYGNGDAMHHHHHHHQQPLPPGMSVGGQVVRYAIPQAPLSTQYMSGGRHKKEIKKRTKTGCLTCRKRRIKCDELKPSCRNCQKSKRACLGYDHTFKDPPSQAHIQPAPSTSTTNTTTTPQSDQQLATPTLPSHIYTPTPPDPYTNSAAASYPSLAPIESQPHYGPGAPLDPALTGSNPLSMSHSKSSPLQASRPIKRITIDDLFVLNDIPPQYQHRTPSIQLGPATQQEINDFFSHHYAGGLDRLLETDWYSQNGLMYMNHDPALQDFVVQCVERFKVRNDDPNASKPIPSLEARLVWQLACMPRGALDPSIPSSLLHRLDIIEKLLTGGFIDPQTVAAPPPQTSNNDEHHEQLYWHDLGRFTAAHDDGSDAAAQAVINDALARMRSYLGMMENRDVLYSIAIVRHIGGRMPDFHPHRHLVATSNDPMDDTNKLKVAHTHVQNEDQRGLTQVIQRICGMAMRSWYLQKAPQV